VLLPLELAFAKQKNMGGLQRRTCSRVEEENGKSCKEGMHAEVEEGK